MNKEEQGPEYVSDYEDDAAQVKEKTNGIAVSSHYMATFKDFLLREELLRAVKEAGFERPSEV